MPRVTVWLDETQVKALTAAAIADRRRPADQAAIIIDKALSNNGIHENTAVTAAVFSEGENDAPSKAHVSR